GRGSEETTRLQTLTLGAHLPKEPFDVRSRKAVQGNEAKARIFGDAWSANLSRSVSHHNTWVMKSKPCTHYLSRTSALFLGNLSCSSLNLWYFEQDRGQDSASKLCY